MMKLKHNFKKGMALVLSLVMAAGLVPAMSGGADTVQAATGTGTDPSVTAFATKDQLMTAFNPDSNGNATTIGRLVFGKNSSGNAQEWYILGADSGVSGGKDNTIIFAASPIAREQKFNSDRSNKNDANLWSDCVYSEATITEVYANHYGASKLRDTLQGMATNTSYFTTAEQNLMNATTVTTKDAKNKDSSGNYLTYTTTDKLYALQGDFNNEQYLWAGTDDSTVLARSSYWRNVERFWLRSPYDYNAGGDYDLALVAYPDKYVTFHYVDYEYAVQPASNLNLSSVLFASAAMAASSSPAELGTIASGTAMTLRLNGTGKNIGTVTYNTTTGDIKVVKGTTSQTVALVVQGNDGTNDWYYSKQITGTETINASDIKSALSLTSGIDLSACKIWLEITDTDGLAYAVGATEAATAKDKLTSITAPQAITVANGTAYDAMNLPATVNIVTEGNTASSAQVTWDTTTPESGSYDPSVLTEQTVTLKGTVTCPDSIDANGTALTTTITITISAAGIVGAPTANPTAGTYTENQSVTLTSSTRGATIYYTTDGSEPTITGGVTGGTTQQYTAPILVTGTVGQSITTTIKAIAVQNGMQDSSVETFTYTIKQDSQTPDVPVVTAPSITTQPGNATVKAGETATFTIAASGTDLTYQWQIDRNDGNGWVNIDGATAASYTTSTVDISCNGFKYQCVVSNSAGTDTSNTAVLTVTENTTPAPGSVDYEILDGANTSWEQNSDGSLSIRGSGAISKFLGVKVDGNLVDVKNYTVKEGSTIVTLKADYLNILSVGNHTFEIIWTDGTASTRFTVSKSDSGSAEPKDNDGNNGKNDNTNNTPATAHEDKNNNGTSGSQTDDNQQITAPKTGDNSHTVLWISLLGVSLAGLLSMIYVRKKKENE